MSVIVFVTAQSRPSTESLPESEARTVVAEISRHHSDWFTVENNLKRGMNAREYFRGIPFREKDDTAKLRDVQSEYFPKEFGDFMYIEFEIAATYEEHLEEMHAIAYKHFNFYTALMKETKDLRFQADVHNQIENWRSANPEPDWFYDVLLFEEKEREAYWSKVREIEPAKVEAETVE